MKELKLRNSSRVALVDDEDYERLVQYKWYVFSKRRSLSESIRRVQSINAKSISFSLASEIMQDTVSLFDHKDCDCFNNQKSNLRVCTYAQNNANRKKSERTTSKYKGVCWNIKNQKWLVYAMKNRKRFHLGYFSDETKAALAYNAKATELWGEFARLNVIC